MNLTGSEPPPDNETPMKLTALEIKQQSFDKTLRGYDVAEVQAFLNMASAQWEAMATRIRELEARIEELNGKVKHYEKVEIALHETLMAARESAESRMEDARKDARILIDKAHHESESILRDAMVRKQEIRQSANQLLNHRGEMINGLRAYLERSLSTLEHFDEDLEGLFKLPPEPVDPAPLRETAASPPTEKTEQPEPTGQSEPHDTAASDGHPSEPLGPEPDAASQVETEKPEAFPSAAGKNSGRNDLDDILDELD